MDGTLFDEAAHYVQEILRNDPYKRFLLSPDYEALLLQVERKESSATRKSSESPKGTFRRARNKPNLPSSKSRERKPEGNSQARQRTSKGAAQRTRSAAAAPLSLSLNRGALKAAAHPTKTHSLDLTPPPNTPPRRAPAKNKTSAKKPTSKA